MQGRYKNNNKKVSSRFTHPSQVRGVLRPGFSFTGIVVDLSVYFIDLDYFVIVILNQRFFYESLC